MVHICIHAIAHNFFSQTFPWIAKDRMSNMFFMWNYFEAINYNILITIFFVEYNKNCLSRTSTKQISCWHYTNYSWFNLQLWTIFNYYLGEFTKSINIIVWHFSICSLVSFFILFFVMWQREKKIITFRKPPY